MKHSSLRLLSAAFRFPACLMLGGGTPQEQTIREPASEQPRQKKRKKKLLWIGVTLGIGAAAVLLIVLGLVMKLTGKKQEWKCAKTTWYDPDGSIRSWEEFGYDAVGNQIKDLKFDADGRITSRQEFTYDAAGNQTRELCYEEGVFRWWWESENDERGNRTKQVNYDETGQILERFTIQNEYVGENLLYWTAHQSDGSVRASGSKVFDDKDRLIRYTMNNENNVCIQEVSSEYDDKRTLRKETHVNRNDGGEFQVKLVKEYDEMGSETRYTVYETENGPGRITYITAYEYDDKGEVVTRYDYHGDGSLEEIYHYENEYDEHGNCSCQRVYADDGELLYRVVNEWISIP